MKRLQRAPSRARRGAALVAALAAVLFVSVLMSAFLQVGLSVQREHTGRLEGERGLQLAETALAEGRNAMRFGGTGEVATADAPARFGGGVAWVVATDLGSYRTRLEGHAMIRSARESVELIVRREASAPVPTGIFSHLPLTIESSTLIDSFDPALGSYADQLAASDTGYVGSDAFVSSNGDIKVDNSASIAGDVAAGPGMDLLLANDGSVTGSTAPAQNPFDLLPVSAPTIASSGALAVSGGGSTVVPSGDHHFTDVEVGVGGSLLVVGPARVVMDAFDVNSNADVTFDTTLGPIEVYSTGAFDLSSNSSIWTPGEPSDMTLYLVGGPGQSISLDSNSEFHGVIYGPEATVHVSANFEVFGAVQAYEVDLAANVELHYDESLSESGVIQALVVVESWRRIPFPDAAALRDRRDPLQVLGVSAADLPLLNAAAPAPDAGSVVPPVPETEVVVP